MNYLEEAFFQKFMPNQLSGLHASGILAKSVHSLFLASRFGHQFRVGTYLFIILQFNIHLILSICTKTRGDILKVTGRTKRNLILNIQSKHLCFEQF